MKKLAAIVFLALMSIAPVHAARPQTPPPAQTSAPEPCSPPAVVAAFLAFTPAQATEFTTLLGQVIPPMQALQAQLAVLQAQLNIALSQPNPNLVLIGNLTMQIHAVQTQFAHLLQNYQTQFSAILTDAQREKVQAVTVASLLQPAVGAFVALRLVPPPAPLPCQNQ